MAHFLLRELAKATAPFKLFLLAFRLLGEREEVLFPLQGAWLHVTNFQALTPTARAVRVRFLKRLLSYISSSDNSGRAAALTELCRPCFDRGSPGSCCLSAAQYPMIQL